MTEKEQAITKEKRAEETTNKKVEEFYKNKQLYHTHWEAEEAAKKRVEDFCRNTFCPLINARCVPDCICLQKPSIGSATIRGHRRFHVIGVYCNNAMFHKWD